MWLVRETSSEELDLARGEALYEADAPNAETRLEDELESPCMLQWRVSNETNGMVHNWIT